MAIGVSEFQFPSNGKAYPKVCWFWLSRLSVVVFQFPSNGKAYPKWGTFCNVKNYRCFNSLQTGKRIQRRKLVTTWGAIKGFNSLQTGKRIQRKRKTAMTVTQITVSIPFKRESVSKEVTPEAEENSNDVSIPFKRESVSKAAKATCHFTPFRSSFNSLQTGKRIQSDGKERDKISFKSFNSLQTGKRIQRYPQTGTHKPVTTSFNSLQTGKRIQS